MQAGSSRDRRAAGPRPRPQTQKPKSGSRLRCRLLTTPQASQPAKNWACEPAKKKRSPQGLSEASGLVPRRRARRWLGLPAPAPLCSVRIPGGGVRVFRTQSESKPRKAASFLRRRHRHRPEGQSTAKPQLAAPKGGKGPFQINIPCFSSSSRTSAAQRREIRVASAPRAAKRCSLGSSR